MIMFSLRTKLFQLILLPIVTSIAFIALALNWFYSQQMDDLIDEKGTTTSLQMARLLSPLLDSEFSKETIDRSLSNTAPAALEDSSTRAVRIYDVNGEILAHSGPQFLAPYTSPPYDSSPVRSVLGQRSTLFTQVVTPRNENKIIGWVLVEISHERYIIKKYQMALITLIISIAALTTGVIINAYGGRRIYNPLIQIRAAVAQMAKGNFDINFNFQQDWAFKDLADGLHSVAENIRLEKHELAEHMEQATEDLRESLDTVEMQNVKLNMARREAIDSSKAKSEFLANTSHEIRTPINGILGFAGLLLKTKLTTQQKEYLGTIQKSSQGLLALINDVLDVSKLEAGQLVLEYAPMNLRDVIEDSLLALAPQAEEKKCQLVAIVDPATPIQLLGDTLRLKQILINLVGNAIKFSDHGSIIVRASPITKRDNQVRLKFSVIDQGIGISQEKQQTLFSAFSQADTSNSRKQGGVGLGLTVAKGLIEKMQGEIALESKTGEGTTFFFTAQFGVNQNTRANETFDVLQGKRVLVSESNLDLKEQLITYFTAWKIQHSVIGQDDDAQKIFTANSALPYDCIIWDSGDEINPRMWAVENPALQKILEERNIPVLLLATCSSDLDYEESADESNIIVIHKPLSHDKLYSTLEQLIVKTSQDAREQSTSDVTKTAKILAVDDNPANLQLIGELLKDLKTEVVLAKDGEQALDIFQQANFDLVFMDIQMPGIDGLEATRRIRTIEGKTKRTPVVALTAHAMGDQKAQLLLAGLDDYLSKPVSEQQLRHIITRWTNRSLNAAQTKISDNFEPFPITNQTPKVETLVDISLSLQLSNYKPSLARDMLVMLLKSLPDELGKITETYEKEDFTTLETIVHKLHGGASYCGVPQLKSTCAKLETLLQQKRYDSIHHTITMLLEAINQLIKWHDEHDLDVLFEIEESV